jgi:predicted metal-dependent enzyme (double-stranded beta helix superfamily)
MSNDFSLLRTFVAAVTEIMQDKNLPEPSLLVRLRPLLEDLVSQDKWLPDDFSRPHPDHYQQYLLHCDPLERFSVVSFVLGPGQKMPPHDHTTWGLIGILRGAENFRSYNLIEGQLVSGTIQRLNKGQFTFVSPHVGDIHEVSNAFPDRVSISIHVYGANIGAVRRHIYDPVTGERDDFVSGYANSVLPNLWNRSEQVIDAMRSERPKKVLH